MARMTYLREYSPRKYTRIAAMVFGAVFVGGFVMSLLQSTVASYSVSAIVWEAAVVRSAAAPFDPTSVMGYLVHNGSIAIGSWLMGFSIVGPFVVLFQNAMGISSYVASSLLMMFAGDPRGLWQLTFIVPHGIFEISGILVTTGAGIYLARATFDSIFQDMEVDLAKAMGRTLPYIAVGLGLIVVAAAVESMASPGIADYVVQVVY